MWPFLRELKSPKRLWTAYVAVKELKELISRADHGMASTEQMFMGYILIQVRDDDMKRLQIQISRIVDLILENDGLVNDITGSLVVATFGMDRPNESDLAQASHSAAMSLQKAYPQDVKIIYGSGNILVGIWGSSQRMTYGPFFPSFSKRLEALCELDFGAIREINL